MLVRGQGLRDTKYRLSSNISQFKFEGSGNPMRDEDPFSSLNDLAEMSDGARSCIEYLGTSLRVEKKHM